MERRETLWWDVLIGLAFAGTLTGVHAYFGRVYPQMLQLTVMTGVVPPTIVQQAEQVYFFVSMFLWVWLLLFLTVVILMAWRRVPHAVFRIWTGVLTVFLGAVLIIAMLSMEETLANRLPPAIQEVNVEAGERSTVYLLYDIRKTQKEIEGADARSGPVCSMNAIKTRATQDQLERAPTLRFYYMSSISALSYDVQFVDCEKKNANTDRVAVFPLNTIAPTAAFCVGPSGLLHHAVLEETRSDARKKFIEGCD